MQHSFDVKITRTSSVTLSLKWRHVCHVNRPKFYARPVFLVLIQRTLMSILILDIKLMNEQNWLWSSIEIVFIDQLLSSFYNGIFRKFMPNSVLIHGANTILLKCSSWLEQTYIVFKRKSLNTILTNLIDPFMRKV